MDDRTEIDARRQRCHDAELRPNRSDGVDKLVDIVFRKEPKMAEKQDMKAELVSAFRYRAQVVSVYDGDTVHLVVDILSEVRELGCYLQLIQTLKLKAKIRLDGLNAPEMDTAAGKASANYLKSVLTPGLLIEMEVSKAPLDKYGRYVGVLYMIDGTNVNQLLIDKGYAEAKAYLPRTVL